MIEFKAVPLASLLNLRNQYLDSLRYPQELHCEWLVAKGTCFCIEQDEERVGYFIHFDRGLVYSTHPEWASTVYTPEGITSITNEKKKYSEER